MASSYSTDLKLELMVTGENAGTWGDKTNTNLNLVQQAIAGVEAIALSDGGDVTLVMSDAAISNARNMVLKLTGTLTGASTLSIPDSIEKFYIIDATAVTGPTNLTVKTVSGTGFTLDAAKIYACYSDGTNITEVSLDTLGGSIGTAGITDAAVTTAKISDNAITTAKISDNQITTAKISDNQITTAKISDNQVTAAKLDDVLTDSGGTAGSYTSASITVDAQGRITAAASGSAGAGAFVPLVTATGPASGTVASNSSELLAYGVSGGGGGGGGGGNPGNVSPGGDGGNGYMGLFSTPISAPFSQPYSVGAGGTGGTLVRGTATGGAGGTGGTTEIANLFSINGGTGGNGGRYDGSPSPGTDGTPGTLANGAPISPFNTDSLTLRPYVGNFYGQGGIGRKEPSTNNPGEAGEPGGLFVFDNSGT